MGDQMKSISMDDLPVHLILEILASGRLSAADLVCLELTSRTFYSCHGLFPQKFRSLVDFAAFRLCESNPIYVSMRDRARDELFNRCGRNWKLTLRFLPSVEQSTDMFQTSAGKMQIKSGRYHTLLVNDLGVYSCGSSLCGVLGHGSETKQCVEFRQISFPCLAQVIQVSASHNHAAFVTKSGEDRHSPRKLELLQCVASVVHIAAGPSYSLTITDDRTLFSFGSGTNFCLGHGEQHNELQPRAVQSFKRKGVHIVRVSAGDEHVVALDSNGFVHTWGKGYCGALGHEDEIDKTTPQLLTILKNHLAVQVCASKRKNFVLVDDGSVYGIGWTCFGSLGFPDMGVSDKVLRPRVLDSLRQHHILQVSSGLYHTVVINSQGRALGFGDDERAQLGHDTIRGCLEPTEIFIDKTTNST